MHRSSLACMCLLMALTLWQPSFGDDGMCTGPPPTGSASTGSCGNPDAADETPPQDNLYNGAAQLLDISVPLQTGTPLWSEPAGLSSGFKWLVSDMSKGHTAQESRMTIGLHMGTHVDAPAHFIPGGDTFEKIPLDVFIGHAYAVYVPAGSGNITDQVLAELQIPHDVERLLIRTSNSDEGLMHQTAWTPRYVALTESGARYLAEHTNVRLVGIDYMSIAAVGELREVHLVLLEKGIIPVEGLDLIDASPDRWYHLTCLPLRLVDTEASPARCVLWGPDTAHENWRIDNWDTLTGYADAEPAGQNGSSYGGDEYDDDDDL